MHLVSYSDKRFNKKLRYRGEHSASDFGTNRKLKCDFLLVIGLIVTYILSCTVSKLWLIIGQIFASDRREPHFNALLGVILANIMHHK